MKDIKSIIIGFLLATCMFLFIGATDGVESMDWNVTGEVIVEDIEGNLVIKASDNGKYQVYQYGKSLYLLDTETAEVYTKKTIKDEGKEIHWRKISDDTPFNWEE